eukprot:m.61720 g.61720  ORF g.61720 m.61720 type:complete len:117 (-) comp16214_c0_seq1:41-391(-)
MRGGPQPLPNINCTSDDDYSDDDTASRGTPEVDETLFDALGRRSTLSSLTKDRPRSVARRKKPSRSKLREHRLSVLSTHSRESLDDLAEGEDLEDDDQAASAADPVRRPSPLRPAQ